MIRVIMVTIAMVLGTSSFRKGRLVGIGGTGYIWILFLCFLWSSEIQQDCKGDTLGWLE